MTVNYFSNNIMLNRKKRTISYASSFSQRREREKTEHVIFSDFSHFKPSLCQFFRLWSQQETYLKKKTSLAQGRRGQEKKKVPLKTEV